MEMGERGRMGGNGEVDMFANGRLSVDGPDVVLDGGVMCLVGWNDSAGDDTTWFDSRRNWMRKDGMRPFRPSRLNEIRGRRSCEMGNGGDQPPVGDSGCSLGVGRGASRLVSL